MISFYLGAPAIAGGSEALAFEQVKAIKLRNQEQGVLAELDFYKQTLDDSALTVKLLKYQHTQQHLYIWLDLRLSTQSYGL
mgnify:CR=1 FL=1